MKVVITRKAMSDLQEIADYITQDNPHRASTFIDELLEAARLIGEAPQGFAIVPPFERRGVRRKPYGNYSIYFRIQSDRVDVIHILHRARNFYAILGDL